MKFLNKIRFWLKGDRIGPDMPLTHWALYFRFTMEKICKRKFQYFGNNADFRPGAYAVGCSKISIGNRVIVRPNCMLFGESSSLKTSIIIEDNVMMGCGIHIYISNHNFENLDSPLIDQGFSAEKQVVLKHGCWIGANVIILPGVIIGVNSVIGAGSVVTKSIPDGSIAVGNPARVIKYYGLS